MPRGTRRSCVIGVLLLALFGALWGSPAQAAVNTHIKVTFDSLIRIDANGNPITTNTQLMVNDFVQFQISFDASTADPVPGDSFSVELPAEFANVDFGRPGREVIKPLMFGASQVGDCLIEQRKFTCTFNDSVLGQEGVKGAISARLSATATTTATSVPFILNEESTQVTIPGTGGIGRRTTNFVTSNRLGKGATGLGAQSTGVGWTINVGGAWLVANKPNETTFTVIDTLPNTLLKGNPNLADITLLRANPATNGATQVAARANGVVLVEGYKIEYTPDPDGMTYRLKVTVPYEFTDQENYQIFFPTVLTAGGVIDKGWTYTNEFTIEGNSAVVRGEKNYIETFEPVVSYSEGFGAFQITKTATGSGQLTAGQKFDVLVSYELPASGYIPPAGWTPPANPFRTTLTLGRATLINPQLPKGTKVTVVEDMDVANQTAAAGTTWGPAKFAAGVSTEASKFTLSDNGAKVSFVIEDQKNLKLNLTNTSVTQATFQVSKVVTGDDADAYASTTFDFDYTCTDGQSGTVLGVPGNGTAVKITDKSFAVGTQCTVKERQPAERAGYTLTPAADATITVKNAVQTVTMINTYRRNSGEFAVAKVLDAGGSRGYETFEVTYACDAAGYGAQPDGTVVPAVGSVKVTADEQTLVGRFPVGTKCSVTGEVEQVRVGYDFTSEFTDEVTVGQNARAVVTVTNTYTVQMGDFNIIKTVVGNGSVGKPNETFDITFTCTPPLRTGIPAETKTVSLTEGEVRTVGRYPLGTICQVDHEADTVREGYTLSKQFSDPVTVPHGEAATVVVTNTYSRDMGEFRVTKFVEAGGSTGSDRFTLEYVCSEAGDGVDAAGTVTVVEGEDTLVGRFPDGTKCRVEQELGAERPGYSLVTAFGDEVTVAKDVPASVVVTNTYSRDMGDFAIAKDLVPFGFTGDASFVVTYACTTDGVETVGQIDVVGDNTAYVGSFPAGTICRVTGEDGAEREGYTVGISLGEPVTVTKGGVATAVVTNTYTRQRGGFVINKTVDGDGVDLAPEKFSFIYTCAEEGPVTVEVTPGVPFQVEEAAVGDCTIVEGDVSVDRTDLTSVMTIDGQVSADGAFTVTNGETVEIEVTNTYMLQRGTFEVTKQIDSEDPLNVGPFTFVYVCGNETGTLVVPADGVPVAGPALPLGTSCTIEESAAGTEVADYDVTLPAAQSVTIDSVTEPTTVNFVNRYRRHTAGFSILKRVEGGPFETSEFTFGYECGKQTGTATVRGNGEAVDSGIKLPTGTTCRVWEESDSANRPGYSVMLPAEQNIVLAGDGSNAVLEFTNRYTQDPVPNPQPPTSSTQSPTTPAVITVTPTKPRPGLPKAGD